MAGLQLLLVAGTHGNEINAPWLIDQWTKQPDLIRTNGIKVVRQIGNPEAFRLCKRYIDRDLNRSFSWDLLNSSDSQDYEVSRAKEILCLYGSQGSIPCQIVIDVHSTTSAMGSSLVVYGRREPDLALASLIQARLGLPVYLHEGDQDQQGFLVEAWPCGLVIEIGPVPQALILAKIVHQTKLILEVCFEEIARVKSGLINYPDQLVVHRHLGSLDFPRDVNDQVEACLHPSLQGEDWKPMEKGTPLFLGPDSHVINFDGDECPIPVFINEAAYIEKHIAMSLTKRELWTFRSHWKDSLGDLIK